MSFIPTIELKDSAAIRDLQNDLFLKTLSYVKDRSAFYKKHFAQRPSEIKSLSDIQKLPVTTKDDLQRSNWDFLCVPREAVAEFTSTSGTLGKPVTVALTKNDMTRLAYNEHISFACADGSENDLYQLTVTLDRQFMAGIAYYEGIRKLGAGIIRVGPGLPAMQWETIQRLQPTVLVAVPSFLLKLIEYANEKGIDVNKSSVKSAICIGESIRTTSLAPNALATKITSAWPIRLYGTYASTEMQTAFTECKHGVGGHQHPELVYVEILDDNEMPLPAGVAGEVTITTFGIEAMPLVRYKTGDVAVLHDAPCACGRTTQRLGPVLGRKQQMIKLKGTTIYPQGVFDIIQQQPLVENFVVEVFENDTLTDELHVYLSARSDVHLSIEKELKAVFQSTLRVVPQFSFTTAGDIERMQQSGSNRKISRFIDRRPGTKN